MLRFIAKNSRIKLPAKGNLRFLSQTGQMLEKASPPVESTTSKASEPVSQSATEVSSQQFKKRSHTLTKFDKWVLVSAGKFKSIAEIPDTVA